MVLPFVELASTALGQALLFESMTMPRTQMTRWQESSIEDLNVCTLDLGPTRADYLPVILMNPMPRNDRGIAPLLSLIAAIDDSRVQSEV